MGYEQVAERFSPGGRSSRHPLRAVLAGGPDYNYDDKREAGK